MPFAISHKQCAFKILSKAQYNRRVTFLIKYFLVPFFLRQDPSPVIPFLFDPNVLELTSTGVTADELVVNDLTYEKLQHKWVKNWTFLSSIFEITKPKKLLKLVVTEFTASINYQLNLMTDTAYLSNDFPWVENGKLISCCIAANRAICTCTVSWLVSIKQSSFLICVLSIMYL